VRRRQAHEALIHRLDAELTVGAVTDLDPALGTDGVLEVLDRMYATTPRWANHVLDRPIGRVVTTDTGADSLVQIGHWSGHSPDTGNIYDDEATLGVVQAHPASRSAASQATWMRGCGTVRR
jgi:hypothetical protein